MSLTRTHYFNSLRAVMRIALLCFVLGTLAHVGHTHELSSGPETHYNCDYCTAFGGLIDAPTLAVVVIHQAPATVIIAAPSRVTVANLVGLPQARAPPAV